MENYLIRRSARKRLRAAIILGFGLLILPTVSTTVSAQATDPPSIRIATFDVDATPPVGSAMAYDPVKRIGELPLRCRGIVILGAEQPIVLCAVDWLGIANEGHDAFRDGLAKAAGTTRQFVAVHTLHQHDAPGCDLTAERLLKTLGVKQLGRFEGSFHREVIRRAAVAIEQSIAVAQPVTHYGWGQADVKKVASNRRIMGDDGKVRAVRFTTTTDPKLRAEPEGVIDPEVSVLSFWNNGQPVAILSYYACHPQSYYRTGIPSPDFPGIARFMRGQDVPEALHVHFNGAGGNIGAGKYNDGNKANRMILAQRMADGMKEAYEATKKWPLTPTSIGFQSVNVKLPPGDHLDHKELVEAVKTQPLNGYIDKADQLAWLERCESGHELDLSCLRIGDVRVIHMPGELFVEYQLTAKLMRPDLKVAMAAYGDYGTGYIGTQIAYGEGGYETSNRASNVTPEAERILIAGMRQLLQPGKPPVQDQPSEPESKSPDLQSSHKRGPLAPDAALKTFEVPSGFEMQIVAAEPNVQEPVAICYDADGKMYVAEYLKFPTVGGISDGPDGQIRLLRDLDNDGYFENSVVFADQIGWPTGVCPWKDGVYVVAAPDLWYFKDTDGDGRADVREKVFTGFGFSNEEGTANNLVWGLDHWIYGAGSNSGGQVTRVGHPDVASVSLRGNDFRFHPVTHQFESISGSEQFGNTFDDWGNRFICQNSKPAVHVVLPAQYLARNPYMAVASVCNDAWKGNEVFRISSPEPWRVARTKIRLSENRKWAAPFVAHNVFTACTGVTIYRGESYPESMHGNLLIGDVQSNLVHRRQLTSESATFTSRRVDENTELIRSTDNWFRPVNFCNAPDGTIHIVDMYREVIETPDSLPDEVLAAVDLQNGHAQGRIYRLKPSNYSMPNPPRLGTATTPELVRQLVHPGSWHRETASRLLFERQDKEAVAELRRQLNDAQSDLAQLHTLHSLNGMDALTVEDVDGVLDSLAAGLREHGVRLAESFLNGKNSRATDEQVKHLLERVVSLANDPEPRVRFQVAFTLGETPAPLAAQGLLGILKRDVRDRWIQAAVISSSLHHAPEMLHSLAADKARLEDPNWNSTLRQLATIVGGRNRSEEISGLMVSLSEAGHADVCPQIVLGLADGLRRSRSSLRDVVSQSKIGDGGVFFADAIALSKRKLADPTSSDKQRIVAIHLLAHDSFSNAGQSLLDAIGATRSPSVQIAAIQSLGSFTVPEVANALIKKFKQVSPAVGSEVVEMLLSRNEWALTLLDEIAAGKFAASGVSPVHRNRLLNSREQRVRSAAVSAFESHTLESRSKVIDRYRASLAQDGDEIRGQQVFRGRCATCHQFKQETGHEVGPNLGIVQNQSAEQLLNQILDPNREVLANFTVYSVLLNDGRFIAGMIAAETPTSVTLMRGEGIRETVLRQNIETIIASGKSLMPEGLEESIDPQQMSDLLAFLLKK